MPLGHDKLNSMVKIMMSEAGVEGYYTNHSLRATAVSRLIFSLRFSEDVCSVKMHARTLANANYYRKIIN